MREKKIILIHGFKKKDHKDFKVFMGYAKSRTKYDLEEINFYDNFNKKTLDWRKFNSTFKKIIKQNSDKEIIIIGYSVGGIMASYLASKYENVTKFYSIHPPYSISFWNWIEILYNNVKNYRYVKKTYTKEQAKRIKQLSKRGLREKYPIRISWNINVYRKKMIKYLKKTKNKEIVFVLSKKDEVVNFSKTSRIIKKNLPMKKNDVTIEYLYDQTHTSILGINGKDKFDELLDFIDRDLRMNKGLKTINESKTNKYIENKREVIKWKNKKK